MAKAASDLLYDTLAELALDLQWSLDHPTDEVWRQLDPVVWESTRNAWAVLQGISRERLGLMFSSSAFHEMVEALAATRRH